MRKKPVNRLAAAAMAVMFTFTGLHSVSAASAFKDVPESHWAYQSITKIAELGYMVGDTSGNYKPDDYISKFELTKILAKIAGYSYTDATQAEKAFYDSAYEKHKATLNGLGKKYSRWNASVDREIAFCMEKGIYTAEDLDQFVIVDNTGAEKLRALSKEEAAIFLVRMIGRQDSAALASYVYNFSDDASVSEYGKPYVYYLKTNGVLAGDAEGKFNPKSAVTKASLAVMLDKTLALAGNSTPPPAASSDDAASSVTRVTPVSGTIDKIFPTLKAVQILTTENVRKIYKIADQAVITLDGGKKAFGDLQEGLSVSCVAENDILTEIKASTASQSAATSVPTATPVPATTPAPSATPVPASTSTPSAAPSAPVSSSIEGIVTAADAAAKTVTVEIRMLRPRGEIIPEKRTYTVLNDTVIIRGDSVVSFNSIVAGDVVRVSLLDTAVKTIELEEKNRSISNGVLLEKKYVEATGTPILVIQGQNEKTYELCVTSQTVINRKGFGIVSWDRLRIGDTVSATAEYDKLLEVQAQGTFSTTEGTVEEIVIRKASSAAGSTVTIMNNAGTKLSTYRIIPDMADIYTLRVGDRVTLRLDSLEVESVTVVSKAVSANNR